ncbi:MAG: AMP-binding protein [Chloroflexaceae bacterium]|nr:AMP-binding protein [Chloroflexaceae bacterium]
MDLLPGLHLRREGVGVPLLPAQDRILNCLPMFHSFGLSMGTVLPLLSGIRTFFYPSPLHYRYIPELCYDSMVTVIFGTDTFLPVMEEWPILMIFQCPHGDGRSRKLRESTTRLWMEKFGIRVFEGYGATEAAPSSASIPPCIINQARPDVCCPAFNTGLNRFSALKPAANS